MIDAYITRTKEINQDVNAVTHDMFNEALDKAAEIDSNIKKQNVDNSLPLLGVPFSCKQIISMKGMGIIFIVITIDI